MKLSNTSNAGRMRADILIALIPELIWALYLYGARVGFIILLSIAFSYLFSYLSYRINLTDGMHDTLAPAVTGVLAAFNISSSASYIDVAITLLIAAAIIAVNSKNRLFKLNAVFGARAVMSLLIPWHSVHTPSPFVYPPAFKLWLSPDELADISIDTPLHELLTNKFTTGSPFELFIGNKGGLIGELSIFLLLVGGIYLLIRRVYSWHIPISFIAGATVFALILPQSDNIVQYTVASLCTGSIFLSAFFIAPMFGCAPCTPTGKLVYGTLGGIITMAVRMYLGIDGCIIAVLAINILSPVIDRIFFEKPLFAKGKK